MAIGIQVTIDPSGSVSGGRVAETSLDKVGQAADKTKSKVNATNAALDATGKAAVTTGKSTSNLSGVMGQAGFQIADFASQVQYGGNVLGALGVQGGQLISIFNPMAGAFLTVAGIVGGQYLMSTNDAAEATKTLTERTHDYIKAAEDLTRAQASFALAETTKNIAQQESELTKVNAKIETYTSNLARFPGSAKAKEWSDALVEQRANADTLNQELEKNVELQTLYRNTIDGVVPASVDAAKAIQDQANQVEILRLRSKGLNEEAYILAGVQRLGADATAEQVSQYTALLRAEFELEQQQRSLTASVKAYDKDGEYLARLAQQAELVGYSARQQAILRAEYALSAEATQQQITQARELAAAIYDQQQARQLDTSDAEFESGITAESRAIAMEAENQSIFEQLENQRQMVLMYQELGIGDAQAHSDALAAIQTRAYQEQASIVSSGLGSLLSLQQTWGDDSSGIYKAVLVAQKTATLYSVLLSSYDAIGKAWASAPFPANLGAVTTATVETGALGAAVEAITPAFATGGMAYGPGTGTSDSFTARLSNGEFVMPAQQTRKYYSELESMRSGNAPTSQGNGPVKVNVINQTSGRVDSASANWVSRDELTVILNEEVPGIVAGEVNNEYSDFNSAMQKQYVTQRNL